MIVVSDKAFELILERARAFGEEMWRRLPRYAWIRASLEPRE